MDVVVDYKVNRELPLPVRHALNKMDEKSTAIFFDTYERERKRVLFAYLWLIFLSPIASLAYVRLYGMLWVFILVTIFTGGLGGIVWIVVELFLTGTRVRAYNESLALRLLREQKMLSM